MLPFHLKIKQYKDWSLKIKLMTITTILVFSSVFIVSVISYIQYTKDFNRQSAGRVDQIIDQVSLNIGLYLDDLFRLSMSPYYNNDVMNVLEKDIPQDQGRQLDNIRLVESFLKEMMIIPRKDILRVYIITDIVYSSLRTNTGYDSKTDFLQFGWYNDALKTRNPIFIPVHSESIDKGADLRVFSIAMQLRSLSDTEKNLGVVKVDADYSGIQDICNKVNMGREGNLLIMDENNNIIYKGLSGKSCSMDYVKLHNEIKASKGSYFTTIIDNRKYLVNSVRISGSNWDIIAVNSLSELNQEAARTRNISFLMAFTCLIPAFIILVLFINRFLSPILTIVNLMKEVQKGNLSARFSETSCNEIGYMGMSFNAMAEKISKMLNENTKLVKEVYEAKVLQKEAQINALNSQIRPHFIYNALNTVSMMIQCGKNEEAVDNINKLGNMLRSIARQDKDTTLQAEMELLGFYLGVQKNRYGDRLDYTIKFDEELLSYVLPSLILQPIVENAVIHGCEAKKGETLIKLYNAFENGNIVIYIEDNGKGISPEVLSRLNESLDNVQPESGGESGNTPVRSSIGLLNVNKRIKIKYGSQFGIKITSTCDVGTVIKVILPPA